MSREWSSVHWVGCKRSSWRSIPRLRSSSTLASTAQHFSRSSPTAAISSQEGPWLRCEMKGYHDTWLIARTCSHTQLECDVIHAGDRGVSPSHEEASPSGTTGPTSG